MNPTWQKQASRFAVAVSSAPSRRSPAEGLRFWLPIALIVSAVWVSFADTRYLTFADGSSGESADLVEAVSGSNPGRRVLFPTLAVTGLVLWRSGRGPLCLRPAIAATAIALILVLGASVLWSVEPARTFRRACVVYFIAIAALGIGRTWTATDLCRAALIMSSVFVGISILLEIRAGSFLQGVGYRLAGVFHPNHQGINTAVLTLSSLCLFGRSRRYRYLAVAVLGIFLTKLTGSRGCILGMMVAIAALYWVVISRSHRLASILALGICLSLGLIFVSLWDGPIPSLSDIARMGRVNEGSQERVFNGRFEIWDACIGAIGERPLVGYGYGAFWTSDRVYEFSRIHGWAFASAHSAYLELALDIGIVGAIVAVAVALICWWTALRVFNKAHDWGILFVFSLISMGLVSGLVDVMFVQAGFVTILLAIGIAMLAMYPHGWSVIPNPMGQTRKRSPGRHAKALAWEGCQGGPASRCH